MKSLKLALLGATFLAGAGALATANAADVYSRGGSMKDSGPVDYAPAVSWTGFYFGVHAGAAFNDDDENKGKDYCPVAMTASVAAKCDYAYDTGDDDDDTTWLAGLHVGYNWQKHGNVVIGIEGDVDFADDIDYLATIRGRLGYAMGRTLLYVTGGAAFLAVEDSFGDDDTLNGWVAGAGIEHKLKENMSIGLEGLYYAFDEDENKYGYGDEEHDFWAIRARLTYHFTDRHAEPLK